MLVQLLRGIIPFLALPGRSIPGVSRGFLLLGVGISVLLDVVVNVGSFPESLQDLKDLAGGALVG